MKLIVALGNPGEKYEKTRHNVAWFVMDALETKLQVQLKEERFKGICAEIEVGGGKAILLKPMTYMNSSGEAVKEAMDFYGIHSEDVLVIYDEMDLQTGTMKLRMTGGSGGHNGINSLLEQLKTKNFNRLRIGISRPEKGIRILDYVLGEFTEEEREKIQPVVEKSVSAALDFVTNPFEIVMNGYNGKN